MSKGLGAAPPVSFTHFEKEIIMKKVSWFKQYKGPGIRRPEGLLVAFFAGILLMGSFSPGKVLGDSNNVSDTPSDPRPVWLFKDT